MGWMDVTVAVLFIINCIKGWTRGFILSILHMVGFIVAWIIAKAYYPMVSEYIIENTNILVKIQDVISTRLKTGAHEEAFTGGAVTDYNIFEVLKLPKTLEQLMKSDNMLKDYSMKAVEGVYQYMAEMFARMFIDLVSIFILFFAVKLLMTILAHVLNGVASLPVLREFNRLGGVIIGGLKGLLIVFIILAILTPFAAMTDNQIIMQGLDKSKLAKYLYDHNPIISLLQGTAIPETSDI